MTAASQDCKVLDNEMKSCPGLYFSFFFHFSTSFPTCKWLGLGDKSKWLGLAVTKYID